MFDVYGNACRRLVDVSLAISFSLRRLYWHQQCQEVLLQQHVPAAQGCRGGKCKDGLLPSGLLQYSYCSKQQRLSFDAFVKSGQTAAGAGGKPGSEKLGWQDRPGGVSRTRKAWLDASACYFVSGSPSVGWDCAGCSSEEKGRVTQGGAQAAFAPGVRELRQSCWLPLPKVLSLLSDAAGRA